MSDHTAGNGRSNERDPMEAAQIHNNCGAVPPPCGWRAECGARTRGGTPCRRPPLAGRKRCALHGGKSLVGVAHPAYRHGRRSRYLRNLAGVLKAGYRAALDDPELLSLREEVALLTARTVQLLDRLKGQEGAAYEATWAELRACILDKGRVAAAEWKRLVDLQSVITAEQAMNLVQALVAAVREEVTDRDTLQRIQSRLLEFLPSTAADARARLGDCQNE